MMVIVLHNAPEGLKKRLSLRLLEVRNGVYMSSCRGQVRDTVWRHVAQHIGEGNALLSYRENDKGSMKHRHIGANGSPATFDWPQPPEHDRRFDPAPALVGRPPSLSCLK